MTAPPTTAQILYVPEDNDHDIFLVSVKDKFGTDSLWLCSDMTWMNVLAEEDFVGCYLDPAACDQALIVDAAELQAMVKAFDGPAVQKTKLWEREDEAAWLHVHHDAICVCFEDGTVIQVTLEQLQEMATIALKYEADNAC